MTPLSDRLARIAASVHFAFLIMQGTDPSSITKGNYGWRFRQGIFSLTYLVGGQV